MAHLVETMMYANAVPWHGLGEKVEGEALYDWRKCVKAAGLDWTVESEPLYLADGRPVSHVANIRQTDKAVLGVVGPAFTILQNDSVFEWFEPFLQTGEASIEAAGSLAGGSRIWALAKIKGAEADVVKGDPVERYVLLSHSHDGSLAVRVGFTDVRVVCNNTLTMAHRDKAGSQLIRLKHTKNVEANLQLIRETMDLARQGFYANLEQFKRLARTEINQKDVERYMQMVLGAVGEEKIPTKTQNRIDHLVELAYQGIGNDGSTLWDAYNAVTQHTTWERGRTAETRLNAAWYGDGAQMNAKALALALEFEPAA